MKYLAILGRQPEISKAELEALLPEADFGHILGGKILPFEIAQPAGSSLPIDISRLGGTIKLAEFIPGDPLEYLANLPEGKITLGVSDYSRNASAKSAATIALKFKKILSRHGRSIRAVENKTAELSTATSLYNGLNGKNPKKLELLITNRVGTEIPCQTKENRQLRSLELAAHKDAPASGSGKSTSTKSDLSYYRVIGVQDIDAYARRDQARPARDAKVGMLPPKLAQILINLCGNLPAGSRILDPFCGTGVVLQEAILMGHQAYGTDLSDRMIEYSEKNLTWLSTKNPQIANFGGLGSPKNLPQLFTLEQGDATTHQWSQPIHAVACEGYLGRPMSTPPADIKLKTEKQECKAIVAKFLKNLAPQIVKNTPVVMAIPAWLRPDGTYSRLEILDESLKAWYNVENNSREGLLYHREGQVVARDIIILRKK